MKNLFRTARAAAMVVAAAAASACADAGPLTGNNPAEEQPAQTGQQALFTLETAPLQGPGPQSRLERVRGRATTAEVHVARLSAVPRALLAEGRAVVLNVAPGKRYVAVGERVTDRGAASLSWAGPLRNAEGRVNLVLTEKGVSGVLRAEGETYSIQPIGEGLVAVVRVDRSRMPLDHPDQLPEEPAAQRQPAGPSPAPQPGVLAIGGPMQVVYWPDTANTYHDLLVAYTPAVASAYWDVTGLSQLAIDLANESYENSDIDFAVRLAGTHQTSYNETGRSHSQHLSAAQSTTDTYMTDLNGVRNNTHADVVMLLVNDDENGQYCGLAPLSASNANAYAVVHYDCVTEYTFHHELGHVQGARHQMADDPATSPLAYAHGYVAPNGAWRTVMATYMSCNGCPRINYWSNPYKTYSDGQVMGTTTYEDNARVLRGTQMQTIRDYRTLSHPGNVTHANAGVANVTPQLSWSAVAGASTYQVYSCIVTNGSSYYDSCFYNVGGTSATSWQNYYPYPTQTGSLSGSYNCPRIAMYRVRTLSPEGLSGYFTQINVCVN